MAQADERSVPRRPAPPSLRPFLHFTRFPPPALDAARRALDDDGFRARVVELADAELVGDVAMLVLDRPVGWRSALAERVAAVASEAEAGAEAREVQRLSRQLERTAERLSTAEGRVDELVAERDAAKATREALRDELAAVRQELEAVRAERARAVRELKATEERAHRRGAELGSARAEVQALQARVRRLEEAHAPPVGAAPADAVGPTSRTGPAGATDPTASSSGPGVGPQGGERDPGPASSPPVDLAAVAAAVADASRAAADLAASLDQASGALQGTTAQREAGGASAAGEHEASGAGAVGDGTGPRGQPGASGRGAVAPEGVVGPPVRPRRRHRRPTRLPGGVLDDTPEALLALARTPEMLLVVDGYNVAKTAWPDLPIAVERERLVDGLADLQARTGVDVLVVFDGAEQPGPTGAPPSPRPIRVRFSPPDVEADDVIVALVADLPEQRPVTVVSSDRRVQRGAADGGANVAQAAQLVALLRR
ncbi:MAG: NYN domain-containing protein [Acidimicrobiales bacterium]